MYKKKTKIYIKLIKSNKNKKDIKINIANNYLF